MTQDCELCMPGIALEQAYWLTGIAEASELIGNFCATVALLRHQTPNVVDSLDSGSPPVVATTLQEILEHALNMSEVFEHFSEMFGVDEVDALCEPTQLRRHVRELLGCYDRMSRLHHVISGRYAAWVERRGEAQRLPTPAARHAHLFGGPPASDDVREAEDREREMIWERACIRVHRQRARADAA